MVEPLNKDKPFCPLQRGCPLSEVVFYRVCIHEYFQLVLCWEVCLLLECPLSKIFLLCREVPELVNSLSWVLDSPAKMVLFHYICQLLPNEAQAEFDRIAAAMLAGGKAAIKVEGRRGKERREHKREWGNRFYGLKKSESIGDEA